MVGGCRLDDVADEFGTPVYVVDEASMRNQAQRYLRGLESRRPGSQVAFASKAFPCRAVYRLMATHPAAPPCSCCGGFPQPIRPLGPTGFPKWLGSKVEAWLNRMHRRAQRAESGGGQQA